MSQEGASPTGDEVVVSAVAAVRKKAADRTPDESAAAKKYNNAAQTKSRDKAAKRAATMARKFDSSEEVSKKEAKRILLDERKIQNEHVADVVVELAEVAARQNGGLVMNRHLFTHGLRATLAALEADDSVAPPEIALMEAEGEVIHLTDLYALWDMGFWRQPETTFEEWLSSRFMFKNSAFELSKILGKEDFGSAHESWTSFVPRWNPHGLRPGYTQKQALAWLDEQQSDTEGGKKRYLLVASRNSMKSTFIRIHALCLTITYPDARILIVSETNKLSKKAMKEFRGYLEAAPNNPSLFQQYFSEFTIDPDEGEKLIYDNPLALLGLPQNSVESSSMESSNTGSRFDFCIFDDPISRDNGTSNEEQRAAALAKHGSIMKLREPAGFAVNVQTPWALDDLGDVMVKRNEEDIERPLAVCVDPVMEIKPDAADKPLLQLTEQDVLLSFLPKLNWRFVRDEMRSPEGIEFFKSQYLCQWPRPEDEGLTVSFTEAEIRARIRPPGFFQSPVSQTVMSIDRAYSISKTADYSCIAVGRIMQREGRTVCVVADIKMERLKESELVEQTVLMIQRHNPVAALVVEKDRGYENLVETIRKTCVLRGVPCPFITAKPIPTGGKNLNSKARRIKELELPLSDGRLWFCQNESWNQVLIDQFVLFNGINKSSQSRKDDIPDAISLLYETYMPRAMNANDQPNKDQESIDRETERAMQAEMARIHHARMFGDQSFPTVTTASQYGKSQIKNPEPETPNRAADPRLRIFGGNGMRI
jgi:hypothetical protein